MEKQNEGNETKFVRVLREIMRKRNFTQLKLAQTLGIRQSQISNWLNGKTTPTYTSLQILKDKLNVVVEEFFI